MTHQTIEAMARAICRIAGTCNPHLYEQDAKSAARTMLEAVPSETVLREAMDKMWGRDMNWSEVDFDKTRKFLRAVNDAHAKEMGL